MNKRFLIINSDDFGLTMGISEAILDAMNQYAISDTNFVASSPYSLESLHLAKKRNINAMGIHLNLNIGNSVYYKKEMSFFKEFYNTKVYFKMLYNEFQAQIECLLENGIKLSHITYHKDIITNINMANIIQQLANEYDVPVRRLKTDTLNHFLNVSNVQLCQKKLINQGYAYTINNLRELLKSATNSVSSELVCHLGFVTPELSSFSSMVASREREYELFTSSSVKCMIKEMGFHLINYTQLKDWYNGTRK